MNDFAILNGLRSALYSYAVKDNSVEQKEMDLFHSQYQALLEISEAIASHRELEQLFKDLAPRLHRVEEFDFANLILHEPARKVMKSHVLETPDPSYVCLESGERYSISRYVQLAMRSRCPVALRCSRYHGVEEIGRSGLRQPSRSRVFRSRCDFLAPGGSVSRRGGRQRAQFRAGAVGSGTTQRRARPLEPFARGEQCRGLRARLARTAKRGLRVITATGAARVRESFSLRCGNAAPANPRIGLSGEQRIASGRSFDPRRGFADRPGDQDAPAGVHHSH